ncbi:WD repeat-containing protein 25 [Quercus lobata]|uniref:WD repeat-containing protein 25 n=1 Tax=Quercus lobata TaxID=97700 RepID=UPI00124810BB|nr:WD repeat-containing protein 25 [Quercus lobata]
MDLLHNAYSTASDDDDEVEEKPETKHQILPLPSSKRPKPDNPYSTTTTSTSIKPHYMPFRPSPNPSPSLQTEAPVPGRYVSKRERALVGSSPRVSDPNPNPNPPSTTTSSSASVFGSISDSSIPHDIMSSLRHQREDCTRLGRISERLTIALCGHTKAVNAIHWSPSHAHLLASAGMDHTICIWNVWSRDQKKARVLSFHNAAVKDVRWSQQGLSVLSCGYDCSSRLVDIEKGIETQVFREDQVVGVIKFHPDNCNLFLSGGAKGHLRLWDIRTSKVVHDYIRSLGSILDVEFSINGKQFISSSDVSRSNVSENSIIVWDVSRQVPLSNQVYVEAYTCPCVRRHPFDPFFVAQSNANYIAIFSSSPPFKLDKYKRYENHGVSGFPIKCNFSLDGEKLASGSSDGSIYFYNYRSSKLVRKIKAYEEACIDVAFHPMMANVIASCSWNGDVSIFE